MTPLESEKEIRQILERYSDMVVRIACHHVRSRTDAEDIAQEVFVRLITAQPHFESEEHRKAWLIRVTSNLCRNQLKSFRSREVPFGDPYYQMEEDSRDVQNAVYKLPGKYRNVVYLYYYEGYSVAEIASLLGKKQNTVASWLHRARAKLKLDLTGGF